MGRIRSKDTKPELAVRKALHRAGFRYRLYVRDLPGRPDIVLPKFRNAVFVHGCFWHGHGCRRSRLPSTNVAFWTQKIVRNIQRDEATEKALRHEGWGVAIVWQCRLQLDLAGLLRRLMRQRAFGDAA